MPSPYQSNVDTKVHAENDIHQQTVTFTAAFVNSTNIPVVRLPYDTEIVGFHVAVTGNSAGTAAFTLQDGGAKGTATTAISAAGTFASATAGSALDLTETGKKVSAGNWLTIGVAITGTPTANVFGATVDYVFRDV